MKAIETLITKMFGKRKESVPLVKESVPLNTTKVLCFYCGIAPLSPEKLSRLLNTTVSVEDIIIENGDYHPAVDATKYYSGEIKKFIETNGIPPAIIAVDVEANYVGGDKYKGATFKPIQRTQAQVEESIKQIADKYGIPVIYVDRKDILNTNSD